MQVRATVARVQDIYRTKVSEVYRSKWFEYAARAQGFFERHTILRWWAKKAVRIWIIFSFWAYYQVFSHHMKDLGELAETLLKGDIWGFVVKFFVAD